MTMLARATITGPEAAGTAELHNTDGRLQVQLHRLHVAPGAPDVRLYLTSNPAGGIDQDAHDLGHLPDGDTATFFLDLPTGLDPHRVRAVVVHCTIYSVTFGTGRFHFASDETSSASNPS